jgi:cytochrome c oxidase cbb3-type subunit IV
METYGMLRHLADSWVLLGMFLGFVGMIFFLFRPGAKRQQQEAAKVIFRNDDRPMKTEVKP